MAEFEQVCYDLAVFERQKTPFRVIQLAEHRDIKNAVLPQFSVHAYIDGHELSATAETAKDAFAKAIEWRIVGSLADVSISDGSRSYSIVEFSSVMALAEIANTIKGDINTDEDMLQNSHLGSMDTITVHASNNNDWVETQFTYDDVAKANSLTKSGWDVHIRDSEGRRYFT